MLENLTEKNLPQLLARFTTDELEKLVHDHPYFQQAHILLAKKYQQENNPKFDEQLQIAALYTQNRELLFSLFHKSEDLRIVEDKPVIDESEKTSEESVDDTIKAEDVTQQMIAPSIEKPVNEQIFTTPLSQEDESLPLEATTPSKESFEPHFSESHTFDDWLKLFDKKALDTTNITTPVVIEDDSKNPGEDELEQLIQANLPVQELVEEETHYSRDLSSFIEEQKQKHNKLFESKAKDNEEDIDTELITETMAKIYAMQKKNGKAIKAYEVLALKYPEKNDFFAARINYLKNIT